MNLREIGRRLDRLDPPEAAKNYSRVVCLTWDDDRGETKAEAFARWEAENPGQPPLRDDDDTLLVILRPIVSPNKDAP